MHPTPNPAGPPATQAEAGVRAASSPRLVERYAEYRRRQGHGLLSLMPRDGLRAVLARAGRSGPGTDDLDRLAELCADLLPLPPYSVWLRDFHRNREVWDAEAGGIGATGGATRAPVTVELRLFSDPSGAEWVAALELAATEYDWRGRIRFHAPRDGAGVTRTAEIFREALPTEVRRRFLATDEGTLRAFLRSTLP